MPVHDWTRVSAGTFHDFHNGWITHLKEALNGGVLPAGFYAQSEQHTGDVIPDVLALRTTEAAAASETSQFDGSGAIAVAEAPPRVSRVLRAADSDTVLYSTLRRTLVIRHASGHRIVALIEILSPSNKATREKLDAFLAKAESALAHGFHLLIVDLLPPGRYDPAGIHELLWERITDAAADVSPPEDHQLTLAAYAAAHPPVAYFEYVSVGSPLPEMPLFLDPSWYVNVPLEATYMQAWHGVPEYWRDVIEKRTG